MENDWDDTDSYSDSDLEDTMNVSHIQWLKDYENRQQQANSRRSPNHSSSTGCSSTNEKHQKQQASSSRSPKPSSSAGRSSTNEKHEKQQTSYSRSSQSSSSAGCSSTNEKHQKQQASSSRSPKPSSSTGCSSTNNERQKQQANYCAAGSSSGINSAACGSSTRSERADPICARTTARPRSRSAGMSSKIPRPRESRKPKITEEAQGASGYSPMPSTAFGIPGLAYYESSFAQEKENKGQKVKNFREESVFSILPLEVFGLKDYEDAKGMAQVLAASQQEYLDAIKADWNKKKREKYPSTSSSSS